MPNFEIEELAEKANSLHGEVYKEAEDASIDALTDEPILEDAIEPDLPIDDSIPKDKSEEDYKHKYDVLQGKYNAELERMNQMVSSVFAEKELLAAQVAERQRGSDGELSEEDDDVKAFLEEYPNMATGIQAIARKIAADEAKKVRDEIAPVQAQVSRSNQERYYERLANEVPDWEAVNKDPEFAKFVDERDRYSGMTKREMLMSAFASNDVARTAVFFNDFKESKGISVSGNAEVVDGNASTKKQRDAARDVAPETSTSAIVSKINSKDIISREEISKFYRDKTLGKLKLSQEDTAKIEAKFFRAIREGKVR